MANFTTIKARYLDLLTQANELFAKVSVSPTANRITYESEVNAIDFAIMKLAKVIRKNPSIQAVCGTEVDLQGLKNRVTDIIQLIHESQGEESISRIALNAFTNGVIGGAIHGIVDRNLRSKPEEALGKSLSQNEEQIGSPELVRCAHGAKIAHQKSQTEAQRLLQEAEIARNQAQETTRRAYADLLNNVEIRGGIPDLVNTGDAICYDAPGLIQAKMQEEVANSRYNEALSQLAQEQAALSKRGRDVARQDPKQESGFWDVVWNGTKLTFGFVVNLFSTNY